MTAFLERVIAVAALAAASSACSPGALAPEGQLVLYATTDAPLPPPDGAALAPNDPTPLFDAIRFEIYKPGETSPCDGCSREFAVDQAMMNEHRVSAGVLMEVGRAGYVARVRMYRLGVARNGEPRSESTVDTFVALPPIEAEGIVEATVVLAVDSVAAPRGTLDAPMNASNGPPAPVTLWPGALRVPCNGDPLPGEGCVPGGAFWMGDPDALPDATEDATDRQRIVVLSPFFVDLAEATVGDVRAAHGSSVPDGVFPWSGHVKGDALGDYCTFASDGSHDALPINCIAWLIARSFCVGRGEDLPTEAELEYLESGLRGFPFPWGIDPPSCEDAVTSRAGVGYFSDEPGNCRPPGTEGGALPGGNGARDRLELTGGSAIDLAGNLAEWARDDFSPQGSACWPDGVLVDPLCNAGGDRRTIRGGSWALAPDRAAMRVGGADIEGLASVGYRCVRPGL